MDIIIVGAGIAGLGAGVGLRRAGHKVTVGILCPRLKRSYLTGTRFSSNHRCCMK